MSGGNARNRRRQARHQSDNRIEADAGKRANKVQPKTSFLTWPTTPWGGWVSLLIGVIALVLTLITTIVGWRALTDYYEPKFSISNSDPLDEIHKPYSQLFVIKNDSNYPVTDVEVHCEPDDKIVGGGTVSGLSMVLQENQFPLIMNGDAATVSCARAVTFEGNTTVDHEYERLKLYLHFTFRGKRLLRTYLFKGYKDAVGKFHFSQQPAN